MSATAPRVTPLSRPRELDRLPPDRSAVIEASAGTGKTYLLEHLVLELIITGRARLEEILIVTFTERATAELLARVRRKLDQALASADVAAAGGDGDGDGDGDNDGDDSVGCASGVRPHGSGGGSGWIIDGAARARLTAARRSFDQATIATIHAFCQRVLTDEPLATGRLIGQTQVDGRRVFGETFRDVLRRVLTTSPAHRPVLDAYLTEGGSVEGLETLLYRAATGRGRWAIPFDDARVADIAARLIALDLTATSFALRPVLGARSVTTLTNRLRPLVEIARACLRDGDWTRMLVSLDEYARFTFFDYLATIETSPDQSRAIEALRPVATGLLDLPTLDEAVAQRFLPLVNAALAARKLGEGWTDYDDMIRAVDDALGGPLGPALIAKLRARYRFALVDEAQDTEPAQWRIFQRVFLDSGAANPVVLIGDPKQAIYGFRGADVHTYVAAREEIRGRGGTILRLQRNFRSHPEVVDAVNAILDHRASPRYFSDGDIAYDEPVHSELAPLGQGPAVTLLRAEPDPGLARPPRVGEIRRALRLAIVDQIQRLRVGVDDATGGGAPAPRLRDIFVLTRSNAEAVEVGTELRRAGIAHALYKPDRLFESREATDIRTLLTALAAPTDRVARMHAWLTPFFDVTLAELAAHGDPPADHPLVARLAAWKALGDARATGELWARILDDSGVTRRLRMLPSGQRRLANYRQLFDWLLAQAAARPASIPDLVALLASRAATPTNAGDEEDNTQRAETEDDAVQIMTVHKAKGLEADVVFLYGGLTRARFWRYMVHTFHERAERLLCVGKPRRARILDAIEAARHQEDQRLLYVAMTRARRRLILPFFPAAELGNPDAAGHDNDLEPFKKLSGEYVHVNQRLRAIWEQGRVADNFRVSGFRVPAPIDGDQPGLLAALARADLAGGAGAREAGANFDADDFADAARLRAERRGFVITSYSRLKDAQGGYAPPPAIEVEVADPDLAAAIEREPPSPTADAEAEAAEAARADADIADIAAGDTLPGGVASGLLLHAVLERVALGELPPLPEWQRRPDVRRVLEDELRRWDRDPRYLAAAARLTHAALTAPIPMPDGSTLPGMARAARVRREVGFLFPLPDGAPRGIRLDDEPPRGARVDGDDRGGAGGGASGFVRGFVRGFLRGFLDVLFEHQGRVCFADWKSDVLPAYGDAAVKTHVAANYELQLQIYTLALVRMLGVASAADYERRFGGAVYIFLRGLHADAGGGDRPAGHAIHVARPSYGDVLRWDRELASASAWPGRAAPAVEVAP